MADPLQGQPLLDLRIAADAGLARLGVDVSTLPADVLVQLRERHAQGVERLSLSRYVLLGELGRGGMGVVYEAWDPHIERRVAIKTLEPDLVPEEDREEVIERFRRETKVVGRLRNPGIVTIFDYGEERPEGGPCALYFYVMEYLIGRSLGRVLRERRQLPDRDAVEIAARIAESLHVAHAAGVIHRDIKPSNIFLRNDREAILLDFGIAKTAHAALTRQGQILGTPSYLAPERLREKEGGIDGRSDIFSLGVLLFTMLTGEAPFVGHDVYQVIDKIARESHPKLARSTPAGQRLSRILDRMLAKRPEDRFATAEDAALALRDVLALLSASEQPTKPEGQVYDPEADDPETPNSSFLSDEVTDSRAEASGKAIGWEEDTLGGDASKGGAEHSVDLPNKTPPPGTVRPAGGGGSGRAQPARDGASAALEDTRPPSGAASASGPARGPGVPLSAGSRTPQPMLISTGESQPRAPLGVAPEVPTLGDAPTPAPAAPRMAAPRSSSSPREGAEPLRAKRARIEASHADEDDVVVRPSPLDPLGPDEVPTQGEYKLPHRRPSVRAATPVPLSQTLNGNPALRGALPDPAEARAEPRFDDTRPRKNEETETASQDLTPPPSAAVARRTFGARDGAARGSDLSPGVQVRVFAGGAGDRARVVRRRAFVLFAAMLAAVAVGLMLGRMRLHGAGDPPVEPLRPADGPHATAPAGPAATGEARPMADVLQDAQAALNEGQHEKAERLFAAASDAAPDHGRPWAQAVLGRADALVQLGRRDDAIAAYRAVAAGAGSLAEGEAARLALRELGVPVEPRPRGAVGPATPRTGEVSAEAGSRSRPSPDRAPQFEPQRRPAPRPKEAPRAEAAKVAAPNAPADREASEAAGMTTEQRCLRVLAKYLQKPPEAVRAFEELRQSEPRAPCVYWHLANSYARVGDDTSALASFRQYLILKPDADNRTAVEERIRNLSAKVERAKRSPPSADEEP